MVCMVLHEQELQQSADHVSKHLQPTLHDVPQGGLTGEESLALPLHLWHSPYYRTPFGCNSVSVMSVHVGAQK